MGTTARADAVHRPDAASGSEPGNSPDARRSAAVKRSAAMTSLFAAVGITLLKLITAVLTGSLGLLSEAAHSGIDLIAALVTLVGIRAAERPADADHNYGHGKIESLSAATEILLMLGSCVWIGETAISRLLHRRHLALQWSVWPFLVLLLSIAVDWSRSRNLRRVAGEERSDALEADAVHFGTDIWSSAAVLFGLLMTYAGERFGVPQLEYADPVAALVVACIILVVTAQLARRTLDILTDATPPEVRERLDRELRPALLAVEGVFSVSRVRVRRAGAQYFLDLTLGLPRGLTFQRSEQITFSVTEAVRRLLPDADVVIHAVPVASLSESVFDRVRAVAARAGLAIHDVTVQQHDDGLHLEQHLEVREDLSLRSAHDLVTGLETEQRREVPELAGILTHIESEPATIGPLGPMPGAGQIERDLRATASQFPEIQDVHDVAVSRAHEHAGDGLQVNCHCTLPDDLPMARVHAVITELESAFRATHERVRRVLIHPEPATDNRR